MSLLLALWLALTSVAAAAPDPLDPGNPAFWERLGSETDERVVGLLFVVLAPWCLEAPSDEDFERCITATEQHQDLEDVETWARLALALRYRADRYDQLERIEPLLDLAEDRLEGQQEHLELIVRLTRHHAEVLLTLGHETEALRTARAGVLQARALPEGNFVRQSARLTAISQEVRLGDPERALTFAERLQQSGREFGYPDMELRAVLVGLEARARLGLPLEDRVAAAVAMTEQIWPDQPTRRAEALVDLADSLFNGRRPADEVLDVLRRIDPEVLGRGGRGSYHWLMARSMRQIDDEAHALVQAREAVAFYDAVLPESHPRRAQARLLLASLEAAPDLAAVEADMDRLLERLDLLVELGEKQALRLSGELHDDLRNYLRTGGADDARAYARLLRIKGVVGAMEARRLRVLMERVGPENEETQRWIYVLRQARAGLALGGEYARLADMSLTEQLYITQVGEEVAYQGLLQTGVVPVPEAATPEALQAVLPEDGAILDLAVLDGQLVVFVVRPDRVVRVDAGPIAPIEETARRYTDMLAAGIAGPRLEQAAAQLSKLALAPVFQELQGVFQVWLSPEGRLAFVPWGLMPQPDGRMLLETVAITQLPWASLLLREQEVPVGYGSLFMGDPDYGPITESGTGCAARDYRPLPGTAREVRGVRRQVRRPTKVLTGAAASERNFRELAVDAKLIHLATHGFFGRAGCSGADVHVEASMRQGLVFAGANQGLRSSSDVDGLLTAAELALLDLRGTELVVLSACETGLGDAMPGEGVQGLRRAFLHAGVGQMVTSLWPVPDADTAELMQRFYKEQRQHPPAEALRRAQLWMLARDRERYGEEVPRGWGAWIITGAPRRP